MRMRYGAAALIAAASTLGVTAIAVAMSGCESSVTAFVPDQTAPDTATSVAGDSGTGDGAEDAGSVEDAAPLVSQCAIMNGLQTFPPQACDDCVSARCCDLATACFGPDPAGFDAGPDAAGVPDGSSYCRALRDCVVEVHSADGGPDANAETRCYVDLAYDNGVEPRFTAWSNCVTLHTTDGGACQAACDNLPPNQAR